jgi:hypothetical protein
MSAQSLPTYAPLNPMAQMRSGLATMPWFGPERRWHWSITTDYGNVIEYYDQQSLRYILDAELLQQRFLVARTIGSRGFLFGETSVHGSYDGFLDGFLDWYHDLTGLQVAARSRRPSNEFAYELRIGDRPFTWPRRSYLGDLRLGGGLRLGSRWQSGLWVTVPTASKPDGYRKGTVSLNAITLFHHDFGAGARFTYEAGAGLGFTPKHGELRDWQRSVFFMVTQGIRARLAGPLHGYANGFYHSPYYRNTGTSQLDSKELTIDVGALLRFGKGPTWLIGMTQDLAPFGPAVDVSFRLGAYW